MTVVYHLVRAVNNLRGRQSSQSLVHTNCCLCGDAIKGKASSGAYVCSHCENHF